MYQMKTSFSSEMAEWIHHQRHGRERYIKQATTKNPLKRSLVKLDPRQEKYMRHHSMKCVWFSYLIFSSFKKKSLQKSH